MFDNAQSVVRQQNVQWRRICPNQRRRASQQSDEVRFPVLRCRQLATTINSNNNNKNTFSFALSLLRLLQLCAKGILELQQYIIQSDNLHSVNVVLHILSLLKDLCDVRLRMRAVDPARVRSVDRALPGPCVAKN